MRSGVDITASMGRETCQKRYRSFSIVMFINKSGLKKQADVQKWSRNQSGMFNSVQKHSKSTRYHQAQTVYIQIDFCKVSI